MPAPLRILSGLQPTGRLHIGNYYGMKKPALAVFIRQSDVPEHTELAWILSCQTPVPMLENAHSYKDKVANKAEATAGLCTYPVLMSADILIYDSDVVPVGKDQKQHLEICRDLAAKMNRTYGEG